MIPPLSGILTVLVSWAVLFASVSGLGHLAACALSPRRCAPARLADAFWLGLGVLLLTLPALHLVAKMDARVAYPLLALGALGFVLRWRRRGRREGRMLALHLAWALPALVWIAANAALPPMAYDSGLYHFSAIRWAREFPAVPGLGNLHGRLAFNQSSFLLTALLDGWPWSGRGFHLVNSLPVAVLAAQLLAAMRGLFRRRCVDPHRWLAALLLPLLALHSASWFRFNALSSPTPDLLLLVLGMVLMRKVARLACGRLTPCGDLLVLGAAAITVKLSLLASAAVMAAIALWRGAGRRPLGRSVGFATIGLAAWMAHGFVTSGYPLYPSTAAGLDVDWRVPAETAQEMTRAIRGWARQPDAHWRDALTGWSWMPEWSRRTAREPEILLLASFGLLALAARPWQRATGGRSGTLFVLAPGLAGLAFWIFTAPDARFLGSVPLVAAAWPAAVALRHTPLPGRWLGLSAVALSCLLITPRAALPPGAKFDALGLGQPPKAKTEPVSTSSGLIVLRPLTGDQVWDAKLPGAPTVDPRLRLRGSALRQGFTVNAAQP